MQLMFCQLKDVVTYCGSQNFYEKKNVFIKIQYLMLVKYSYYNFQ